MIRFERSLSHCQVAPSAVHGRYSMSEKRDYLEKEEKKIPLGHRLQIKMKWKCSDIDFKTHIKTQACFRMKPSAHTFTLRSWAETIELTVSLSLGEDKKRAAPDTIRLPGNSSEQDQRQQRAGGTDTDIIQGGCCSCFTRRLRWANSS